MKEDKIFIEGIGISGYRSFGEEIQRIGPFKKINLFIGQNNSGKSNILRFLKDHYPTIALSQNKLKKLDKHICDTPFEPTYEIGLIKDGDLYKQHIEELSQLIEGFERIQDHIQMILTSDILTRGKDIIWFPYKVSNDSITPDGSIFNEFRDANILSEDQWSAVSSRIIDRKGEGTNNQLSQWIGDALRGLNPSHLSRVEASFIPAIREIIEGSGETDDRLMSGSGLIKKLGELQDPLHNEYDIMNQFDDINHFLKTVTGNHTAKIRIPRKEKIVQVSIDGRILPLSSLGTGIHELIILASAATIHQNQVLCIEEPEIHLHPALQKHLLCYLAEHTSNQYFIATHSAHLLDTPDVAVFHVHLEDGKSVVDSAITDSHKSIICDELGYKASDILQSNCIIWVEGPSDRIYLNHWIQSKNKSLIEGVHYSIMFYGGRLLRHLSGDENVVDDFIELKRLNRHMGIIMDSDKKADEDENNDTKKRIEEEFNDGGDFVWITQGREIENYLSPEQIKDALIDLYGEDIKVRKYTEYAKCTEYKKQDESKYKVAKKVKLARRIVEKEADFSVLDLENRIDSLIRYIRKSNGLDKEETTEK